VLSIIPLQKIQASSGLVCCVQSFAT
jgi:hypothetical protein